MTTRALVKDHPWSHDKARAGTVDLAVAATGHADGWLVRALPEPLVRRGPDGPLRSVRLAVQRPDGSAADAADLARWRVTARLAGTETPVSVEPGPAGSVRVFLSHVDIERDVEITATEGHRSLALAFRLPPAREWTIHLVHHSHLDIGYTDPQGTVLAEHVGFLDSCLDLTRATDDWPDDARFRWAVESLWSYEQWAAARPPERVAEFLDRVRAGRIELTALPYNLHTDACSTDELHELLAPARRLGARHGLEFAAAMQTDVPGSVAGLPDALHQIGVRYLSVAHNWAGRSVPQLNGGQHLPRLFRWAAPSGASVLVWMTDSPHGLAYMEGPVLGFGASYDLVDDLLPAYLTSLATRPYPFPPGMFGWHGPAVEDRAPYPWNVLHLRVQGHFGDNAPPRLIMSETVRRWNSEWEFPRLRLSTNTDFFADAESRLGDEIETFTGDWGDWWVEGIGSGAHPQAMVRRAQRRITTAQSLYGLAAALDPERSADRAAAVAEQARGVYGSMSLFNEHTWGASNPWTHGDTGNQSGDLQWHWKYGQAVHAADDADTFLDHATAALGARLPRGPELTYWAVNPTAAGRTSIVRLFVPESRIPLAVPVAVRDGRSGKRLAAVSVDQVNPTHRNAGRFLRAVVPDVPPFGLVRLDVETTTEDVRESGQFTPDLLENDHLLVRVDPGRSCISSIVEKATGRELVDSDAVVGFNGYVYDRYATAPGFNHHSNRTSSTVELEQLGDRSLARPWVLVDGGDDEVEQWRAYEFAAAGVACGRVTLRLGRDAAHLEIDNRLDKPATMTKESAYLAFPFAFSDPVVRYEITGALTGAGLDHVPGAPQHMRAMRSFVSFAEGAAAVAWVSRDAPLVEPETIALPYAPFPDSTAPRQPGTVYSWVHNNVWDTNFPSEQGFDTTFRYAVGVRKVGEDIDPIALAVRTAYEVDQELVGVAAEGARDDDAAEQSLLSVSDDRVRVVAVLPHDAGLLVKLQSYAEAPTTVALRCGVPVDAAWAATYLGDTADQLAVAGDTVTVELPRLGVGAAVIRPRPGSASR